MLEFRCKACLKLFPLDHENHDCKPKEAEGLKDLRDKRLLKRPLRRYQIYVNDLIEQHNSIPADPKYTVQILVQDELTGQLYPPHQICRSLSQIFGLA
jgi:hypothetical protein